MPPKGRSHKQRTGPSDKSIATRNVETQSIKQMDVERFFSDVNVVDTVAAVPNTHKSPSPPAFRDIKQSRQGLPSGASREGKSQKQGRTQVSQQAVDSKAEKPSPAAKFPFLKGSECPGTGKENNKDNDATDKKGAAKRSKVGLPASVSGYVMTVRQLHDHLEYDADYIVEELATQLGHKGTVDLDKATLIQKSQVDPKTLSSNSPRHPDTTRKPPSTHLLLLCVAQLSLMLSSHRERQGYTTSDSTRFCVDKRFVAVSTMRELKMLCKLIAWYCLNTFPANAGPSLPGGYSGGTSGYTTPGPGLGSRRGRGFLPVTPSQRTAPVFASVSGSLNTSFPTETHDTGDIEGWFESRMSADRNTTLTLPDTQLSEQLMRPVIEAVSRFSVYGIDTGNALQVSEAKVDDVGDKLGFVVTKETQKPSSAEGCANPSTETAKMLEVSAIKLRVATLMALCAVFHRFPDTDFHSAAFLPLLFPDEDVRAGPHTRHPFLTPLFWDPSPTSRSVAMLALTALLHKLQSTLQFSQEPKHKRQSFVSLATQGGAALSMIHDAVYWAMEHTHRTCATTDTGSESAQEACSRKTRPFESFTQVSLPCTSNDATLWFNVLSALSVVTPYHRCPHSLQVMLDTLESPLLRQHLRDEAGLAFVAATGFLANVFKNESLRSHVLERLSKTQPLAPLHRDSAKVSDGKRCMDQESFTQGFLIGDLLVHAIRRVEVWRCLVNVARFYPKLIQQHFTPLLQASHSAIDALLKQEAAVIRARQDLEKIPTPEVQPFRQEATSREPTLPHKDLSPQPNSNAWLPAATNATSSPTHASSTVTTGSASPEAFVECLRAWTHFMGYTWKAFDNNPGDPALKCENTEDRATLAQKIEILNQIILPTMRLETSEEVTVVTLRCLAQMGENCLSSERVCSFQREEMVRYALVASRHCSSPVRSEAMTTFGVWIWQYPVLDTYISKFLETTVSALTHDPDGAVRTKAAFAVSNLTSRLCEVQNRIQGSAPELEQLFFATMKAVTDSNHAVQSHGIRMINNLLHILTLDQLIADLPDSMGEVKESVAKGFLRTLLKFVRYSPRDAKHRWNAAYALGTGLARVVLFEAAPDYALDAIHALITAVVRDSVFKVRTQAAHALAKIAPECLRGKHCPVELMPHITRGLCAALVSAKTTESFPQFREQAALQAAVKTALEVMITTAAPSAELDRVFAQYHRILTDEGLL